MLRKIRKSYSARIVSVVLAIQIFISSIGMNQFMAAETKHQNFNRKILVVSEKSLKQRNSATTVSKIKTVISPSNVSMLAPADGSPSQPEVQSFEPVGTNQMVDLFTGDFTYNIPLFNIPGPDGGYPINIAYHSGIGMEQEASWVGLGWNINMGTINRQLRNLPDDFGGGAEKEVHTKTDMRPNWTVSAGKSKSAEVWGFESESIQAAGNLSFGFSLFYNNYKGVGYSVDAGFNLGLGTKDKNGEVPLMGDLGLDLGINSQEGINARFGLGFKNNNNNTNGSVSTGFNSRTGWQNGITYGVATEKTFRPLKNGRLFSTDGGGTSISFAKMPTQLSVPNAMRGMNASFSLSNGAVVFGVQGKLTKTAYFDISYLKNIGATVDYKGVGYMYYQRSQDAGLDPENDYRIKDFNRENEGLIHKQTRTLATPTLSYDVYSVTGQGIGNMFRPFRNDIGLLKAPIVKSEYHGGSVGIEKPLSASDVWVGVDLGYNFSSTSQEFWPNSTNKPGELSFANTTSNPSISEDVYFQNYGEQTVDDLAANYGTSVAAERPTTYELKANNNFYDVIDLELQTHSVTDIKSHRNDRKRRAKDIEAFTNEMIMNNTNDYAIIPEFNVKYYNTLSGTQGYLKSNRVDYANTIRYSNKKTHVGAYAATNESGIRYIYGLPAINQTEKDVTFSVKEEVSDLTDLYKPLLLDGPQIDYKIKGTNKYYNSVEKDEYAHSYLLTSILGTDYVDADSELGASDGDFGYWVRIDYARAYENFKWRAPYKDALYNKGYETSFTDGTGSYSYGTKEVWYVATVETKTHIAEFILSDRRDCEEPNGELDNDAVGTTNHYKKLDKINIYAKNERYPGGIFNANAKPIQTCHFVYDYSLCTNSPDNPGNLSNLPNDHELSNGKGKLTLKKLYFTYRNNPTGSTRPYQFEYNTGTGTNGSGNIPYSRGDVDKWGNYQPAGTNVLNVDYPYVSPYTSKAEMDSRAGLYSMKAINLPSGGRYEIDYESDSYAYVQNEVAMQMFTIKSLDNYASDRSAKIDHPEVINSSQDTPSMRNVYFELEEPILATLSTSEKQAIMDRYIRAGEYIYFKVKINMTKNNGATDYVGAYVRVNEVKVDESQQVNGKYLWGYVQLDFMKENGKVTNYHPFTEAGARHLKYNQADLLYDNPPNADKDKLSKSDVKNMGWSLISNVTDFKDLFNDFTTKIYGDGNTGRCTHIDLDKSYLRMRTPDKIKYGGGHRVREIRVIDNWAASVVGGVEATSTYGTVYEYDMKDPNTGEMISSGVAAYEPMIGGDEIPLRNPVEGWEEKQLASKTSAVTYSEDPGNESLYPGPTVGYRQVRVMSKVTAAKMANQSSSVINYTGITQHEFYTAKDYPVLNDRSELQKQVTLKHSRLIVPAIIVNVDRLRMAATQGYYLELNNMHGQPFQSTEIGFDDQGDEKIISNVKYEYFDKTEYKKNKAGENLLVRQLDNNVDVLYKDIANVGPTPYDSDIRNSTIATEVEFIPEERYIENKHISAGLNMNIDAVIFPPLFAAIPIPTFNWKEEKTGTVVTNKIVNKTAIVKAVTATQEGAVIRTENLVFDDMTGQPLLTSVTNGYGVDANNPYGDKVYNYSILAKDKYEGTGAAYKNIGFSTVGSKSESWSNGIQPITLITESDGNTLFPGDVLVASPVTLSGSIYLNDLTRAKFIAVCSSKNTGNNFSLETKNAINDNGLYRFTVIRSGRRNLLTMPVSNIVALEDPTKGRVLNSYVQHPATVVPCSISIDNVLSISAVELGNHWYKDTRQLEDIPSTWSDQAFFTKGFSGNYSPVRSYSYVDERSQTTSGTGVNLRQDGVLNNVAMFNWGKTNSTNCNSAKWKMTEQVTLKNASSSNIETKNILETYSAKLFGKGGTEPIAVAGNAKNTEIGFESFEEYAEGPLPISQNSTTNLNIYSDVVGGTRSAEDRFDISGGIGSTYAIVDVPSSSVVSGGLLGYTEYSLRMHIDAQNGSPVGTPAKEFLLKIAPTFSIEAGTGKVKMSFSHPTLTANYNYNYSWKGELFAQKNIPDKYTSGNVNVEVASKGHAGNKCLLIKSNGTDPEFLQERLTLIPGQNYQFSGWYSTVNNLFLMQTHDQVFASSMILKFYKVDGTASSTPSITYTEKELLQGDFIDDWQKFTANFVFPADAHYMSIVLPKAPAVYDPVENKSVFKAYYDDLRVQPLDGGMQTYVYNQENHRLEAVLDGNNYATFYYYDEQGNLFLVKQETEKGIITKQETRSYIQKSN